MDILQGIAPRPTDATSVVGKAIRLVSALSLVMVAGVIGAEVMEVMVDPSFTTVIPERSLRRRMPFKGRSHGNSQCYNCVQSGHFARDWL